MIPEYDKNIPHKNTSSLNRDVTGLSVDGGSICHERWEWDGDGDRKIEILDRTCLDGEFGKLDNDALSLSYFQWIPYVLVMQVTPYCKS